MMLTGVGWDLFLSCALFLLAVIPSHVHGFYISCTYFHRKRKVRKGRWPGAPKWCIDSEDVLNGGADRGEVRRLQRMESTKRREGVSRVGSTRRSEDLGRMQSTKRRSGARLSGSYGAGGVTGYAGGRVA